jgi:hypothetical protein
MSHVGHDDVLKFQNSLHSLSQRFDVAHIFGYELERCTEAKMYMASMLQTG